MPDSWYQILLAISVFLTLSACSFGGFELAWWGVLLALTFMAIAILPLGAIEAISGQRIGVNVVAELIIGFILPGRMISVMSFKTLCYMGISQSFNFLEDLKV